MDVNMEKGVEQGANMFVHGEKTTHKGGLSGRGRRWKITIGRGAGVRSNGHCHHRKVGVHGNQYADT